jgi:hypothetical protein
MRLLLRRNIGGRKFQCLDCDGGDPLLSREVAQLLTNELGPPRNTKEYRIVSGYLGD